MRLTIALATGLAVAGCCQVPPKPVEQASASKNSVTLHEAIVAVRQALEQASKDCDSKHDSPNQACTEMVYLSDVTLTLEVSGSTENKVDGSGGLKDIFSVDLSHTATQGDKNTVELKFQNPMFLDSKLAIQRCLDKTNEKLPECVHSRMLANFYRVSPGLFLDLEPPVQKQKQKQKQKTK